MKKIVTIDCFPESAAQYSADYAVAAVDIIRATTTAVTCVGQGRRCFPVASIPEAFARASEYPDAVLVGEWRGYMPSGFAINNSPAALARRRDVDRPAILLSTSGTALICNAKRAGAVYVACFRNYLPTIKALRAYERVAVIGAGSRGEFRQEDQMCCAWIAAGLVEAGFTTAGQWTDAVLERWRGQPVAACLEGNSVAYLRQTGQLDDLAFIESHVSDLDVAVEAVNGEVAPAGAAISAAFCRE